MGEKIFRIMPSFILIVLSYLLIWEWLKPLEKLDTIRDMPVFVIYLIYVFVLNVVLVRWVWKLLFHVGFICLALYVLYYQSYSFLTGQWLFAFWVDSVNGVSAIRQQQWQVVPDSVSTFLFLLLLWMITYLINYWVIRRKSILAFFMLTIVFVATLDTFTPYDGDYAIIRIFVIGLFMMGCLRFYRLVDEEKLSIGWMEFQRWIFPLIGMIVGSVAVGFIMPKLPAQWPDPVPTIITYSEKFSEDPSVKKVGYGEDDTKLGGDFARDDSVVFTAHADTKHYWFVEAKTLYTGAGWEVDSSAMLKETFHNHEILPYGNTASELKSSQSYTARVEREMLYTHVPIPSPLQQGEMNADGRVEFEYYPVVQKINSTNLNGEQKPLKEYDIIYTMPVYDLTLLRSIQKPKADEISPLNTQLPDNLPNRIKELAEEIVQGEDNLYDIVKAVEDYFNGLQFEYTHEDIPYPKQGQDFVDHFLFETQRGYCDHFSTSMVILLRTLGIDARWVKGYTGGEFVKYEAGQNIYEITNNNAHSWVEVWFPGVGWVPFEPTKGYSGHARFEDTSNGNPTNASETAIQTEQSIEENQQEEQLEQTTATTQFSLDKLLDYVKTHGWKVLVSLFLLVILIVLIYVTRRYWLALFWLFYFNKRAKSHTFSTAYFILLNQLQRRGLRKKAGQTLREYAKEVDDYYSIEDMSELTGYYERVVYGGNDSLTEWKHAKSLWEKVMKKTIT
ncbi:MAG: transglutaminase domain-containing protein [Bacillus sp. (in: firmicutes)]